MFKALKDKSQRLSLRFLRDRRAIESTEVALILALVVVVVMGAFQLLGVKIADVVNQVAGAI